jgi:hypothetical protein
MYRFVFLFLILFSFSVHNPKAQEIDSLNITGSFITLGESWYTDYFTSYAVYTDRSFFKDANGGLHVVFLANYKMYYCYSDDGETWSTEQIAGEHDGDFREAVIYADADGNPFIAATINPYYNYGNPTGINYGDEFRYNAYFFYKDGENWIEELVFNSTVDPGWSGNYGCKVNELYKNQQGEMVLIGHRYGWYTYGGALWEFTRDEEGNWSTYTIHEYADTPVDHSTESSKSFLKSNGDRNLIYSRPYNASGVAELAYMNYSEGVWSEPMVLTTDLINYRSWDLSVSPDEEMYLIHYSNNPGPHVNMYTDFEEPMELDIDLSMVTELQHAKIHITEDGILDLLVYPANLDSALLYVSEDFGLTWGEPFSVARTDFPGVLPVTDQYSDQGVDLEFIRISRVSSVQPFGPDSLFYNHIEQINSTLGVRDFEDTSDQLNIYPNPANEIITLNYSLKKAGALNIRVFTMDGRMVDNRIVAGNTGENMIQMELKGLDSGTYVLEIRESNQGNTNLRRATRKLVKL